MRLELNNRTIDTADITKRCNANLGHAGILSRLLHDTIWDLQECCEEIKRLRKESQELLEKYPEEFQDHTNLLFNRGWRLVKTWRGK